MILTGNPATDIMTILFLHFVGDFIFQSDKMAKGKSVSNKWLGLHVSVYCLPLILVSPLYALANFVPHFLTDYVSSRVGGNLYREGDIHNFFVVVGFDQLLHALTLILTYTYMFT